jgi:hypothetical protein
LTTARTADEASWHDGVSSSAPAGHFSVPSLACAADVALAFPDGVPVAGAGDAQLDSKPVTATSATSVANAFVCIPMPSG